MYFVFVSCASVRKLESPQHTVAQVAHLDNKNNKNSGLSVVRATQRRAGNIKTYFNRVQGRGWKKESSGCVLSSLSVRKTRNENLGKAGATIKMC